MQISLPDDGLVLILILSTMLSFRPKSKVIVLGPIRFRQLVESQDRPIIIRMNKGFLRRRPVYLLPHQGLLFQTDVGNGLLPVEGVTIIENPSENEI